MSRFATTRTLFLLALPAAAACSGGAADTGFGGTFTVLGSEPLNGSRLFLNDPISFDFTTPVDVTSADLNTVSFTVLDLNGTPLAEQPTGAFVLDQRPGPEGEERRLKFLPTLPTNDDLDNGGFRPGRTYLVRLVGGARHNGNVLRDQAGNSLGNAQTFRFTTADGTTPSQLFRNRLAGGPRRRAFAVTPPAEATGVPLNKFSSPAIEVRLEFDQSLNPSRGNVPVALDTDPVLRSAIHRGRIYLQYQEGLNRVWIPASTEFDDGLGDLRAVILRPVGVLPNNADIEVIVEPTLEDISGESNVGNVAYSPVFATFRTQPLYEPQFDALVEDFLDTDQIDFDAPFLEPQAEVGNGFVRAGFEFEGTSTPLDYEPTDAGPVLNTNFTQVVPDNGLPFNVSGGVFNFRNVTINNGVTLRGTGTRPMVWLVSGNFVVNGRLTVGGGAGARVNTLRSANFPTAGGVGACGGGNGGRGSPSATQRDPAGQAGFGPFGRPNGGGGGGRLSCTGCGTGSGGGGGSLATQGDPWYKSPRLDGTSFQQVAGIGGAGCRPTGSPQGTLAGGAAGPRAFTDARTDNDFWGAGINVHRQLRIRGELAAPVAGAGGGGGGDTSGNCQLVDPQFANDTKGGGGGGGGGVLIVKALGSIVIGRNGRIDADGGHGGGGEAAGSCNLAGGGGAGSGGMVILMSATGIDIFAKSTGSLHTYRDNEYQFAISADGGVCQTGQYRAPDIEQKYSLVGTSGPVVSGTDYDLRPLGAFGGMGVVQLMAPPGDPQGPDVDSTNTVLDDNILYRKLVNNQPTLTTGADKKNLLAWKGFRNALGVEVDDFGQPTITVTPASNHDGDIRPTPILLPVPFHRVTRARSKWIDLGAAPRRSVAAPNGEPRSVLDPTGAIAGPTYTFAGVTNDPSQPLQHGYAAYQLVGTSARVDFPAMLAAPAALLSVTNTPPFRGQPAYRLELANPDLAGAADRFVGYECELWNASGSAIPSRSYRILGHGDRVLTVAADAALPTAAEGAASVQIRARFFQVFTGNSEGLGTTYLAGGRAVPLSSVKIGFAFHQNPDPLRSGFQRYPISGFAYDLTDPAVVEFIRQRGMRFLQWDIQLNSTYRSTFDDQNPRPFGPTSPRPEVRDLRLPFRF